MTKKRDNGSIKPTAGAEGEALDALNIQMRRKRSARRFMEATIEAKAKKRRDNEKPPSSAVTRS